VQEKLNNSINPNNQSHRGEPVTSYMTLGQERGGAYCTSPEERIQIQERTATSHATAANVWYFCKLTETFHNECVRLGAEVKRISHDGMSIMATTKKVAKLRNKLAMMTSRKKGN